MDAQDLTTATSTSTTTRFLFLKSLSYKSVFDFALDQLLLKTYSVKNRTLYKTLKQEEFAVVDFQRKIKYVIRKQLIKSEDEYGFVGETLRIL